MFRTVEKPTEYLNHNDTDNLDDTLPIEFLESVETTTNEDWLTRETPHTRKVTCTQTRDDIDVGIPSDISVFNPPLCSTRLKSGCSDLSTPSNRAECSSSNEDDAMPSAALLRNCNRPLVSATSMEFQPLRCSTGVAVNDIVEVPPAGSFGIRCDSTDSRPLRISNTESVAERNIPQRSESVIEFNPLRCSTDLSSEMTAGAVIQNTAENRNNVICPISLSTITDEFFTACNLSAVSMPTCGDAQFFSALSDLTQNNGREVMNKITIKDDKSPFVQTTENEQIKRNDETPNVDNDLSILMQCHLKIRNGRQVISNLQAKPCIEFSIFKESPSALVGQMPSSETEVSTKVTPSTEEGFRKVSVEVFSSAQPVAVLPNRLRLTGPCTTNFTHPSVIPRPCSQKAVTSSCGLPKNKGTTTFAHLSTAKEQPTVEYRAQEDALASLASGDLQETISAIITLDSARSSPLCETISKRGLTRCIYEFLSKINRPVYATECIHATSILIDLAKYSASADSVWQKGERVTLLFNLMGLWASINNEIFVNCVTIVWVFSRDKTRASIVRRRFVDGQKRLLEKISIKLYGQIQKPPSCAKTPALKPSWISGKERRTFGDASAAFSGLCSLLKIYPS